MIWLLLLLRCLFEIENLRYFHFLPFQTNLVVLVQLLFFLPPSFILKHLINFSLLNLHNVFFHTFAICFSKRRIFWCLTKITRNFLASTSGIVRGRIITLRVRFRNHTVIYQQHYCDCHLNLKQVYKTFVLKSKLLFYNYSRHKGKQLRVLVKTILTKALAKSKLWKT